ncbi:MAG: hypothetical protein O7G88_16635 [bacterium]|nr:hypothetical protein [bacterium]
MLAGRGVLVIDRGDVVLAGNCPESHADQQHGDKLTSFEQHN